MKRDVEVKLIKVIQIRHVYEMCGKPGGYNKKYQKPKVAAEDWARIKNGIWEDKKFGNYRNMGPAEWDASKNHFDKLVRRSLPIFKRMLA